MYAKEWLDAKDIHRRNNKWIGYFYSGKTNTAVIELRRDCYRAGKFMQYYSCYNLGLIYAKIKKFKESEKVLQRALSLNPDFAPALNLMIQNKLQLPDKLARIRLWEQARTYAQKKMKTQLFIVLNELKKYQSPAREVFESSPEFSWLSKSKEFQKVMEGFPSAEREMDQLLLSGQLANPLIAALDIRYTRKLHDKNPNKERLLYWWFLAEDQVRRGKLKDAVDSLKNFQYLIERASLKRSEELMFLPVYSFCFMLQSDTLQKLKKNNAFKIWVRQYSKRVKINSKWVDQMLVKS